MNKTITSALTYLTCATFALAVLPKSPSALDGLENLDEPKAVESPKPAPELPEIKEGPKDPDPIAISNYQSITKHLTLLSNIQNAKNERDAKNKGPTGNTATESSTISDSFAINTLDSIDPIIPTQAPVEIKNAPEQESIKTAIEVVQDKPKTENIAAEAKIINPTLAQTTATETVETNTQSPPSQAIIAAPNTNLPPVIPETPKINPAPLVAMETTVVYNAKPTVNTSPTIVEVKKKPQKTAPDRWIQSDLPRGSIYPNNKGVIVIGVVALPLERAENPFDLRYVAPGSSTESTVIYSGAILNTKTGQPIAYINGYPAIKGEKINGAFNLATIRRDEIVLERNGDNYVIALNQPIIMRLTN